MATATLYTYHLSGRRPATIFAFILSLAMLLFVLQYSVSWYFIVPVAGSAAMAFWSIVANPITGSMLTEQTLCFTNRGNQQSVSIQDVTSMKVTNWTDGPDTVALTLKSGSITYVPSTCADSKLAVALRELGIIEA